MSVDPDQPSSADAPTPKSASDPAAESAEVLRQKRRFKKGSGTEPEEGEKPDQTIQLLSSLLQDLIAKKELPTTAETEAKTSKYHRLSKTGSGATGSPSETTAPAETASAATPAAEASANVSTAPQPSAPPSLPPITFRPAPLYEPAFKGRWAWTLLLVLIAIGGTYVATTSYKAPTPTGDASATRTAATAPATTWTDATLSQLDQALAADQAGDIKGAQRIASAIKKPETPPPPGLDLYLASLITRADHTYDAEADLLRAVTNASPVEAAAINERLAFNFSRARDFQKAVDFYKSASRTDPFSASLYYHWAEAMRHMGHFQDAVTIFRRALDRIPTGQPENESLRACIDLKLRLALLEQGQESEFQAGMAEQVKAPSPSGYWLLTAAAVSLQHKNLPDATSFLGRAREALGVTQFDSLLNDYFFRAYADRKELADFFPSDPAARRAKLQPTMTYSVEP